MQRTDSPPESAADSAHTARKASKADIAAMLRVNQAGEYGAMQIYAGQRAVFGDQHPCAREIAHMAKQEQRHLDYFNKAGVERGVRPTLLQPLWKHAGFALGAVTAAISPQAAMACTEAVETEIDRHYQDQLAKLGNDEAELSNAIAEFRKEELEHRDIARKAGAQQAIGYPLMSLAIRGACRAAIALAKRV